VTVDKAVIPEAVNPTVGRVPTQRKSSFNIPPLATTNAYPAWEPETSPWEKILMSAVVDVNFTQAVIVQVWVPIRKSDASAISMYWLTALNKYAWVATAFLSGAGMAP
jgi:hypothetical protein